ncbi:hypothetical protein [Apilactobacillus micheneri]|uniref:hypothetical protein n=1 Tax=Apilactobacillus micheneri TaxID=1899430 RepID=UPI0011272387|nr:hypothetical protein [Apilactobacillus micheneri]TPR38687.1 hypothetical protein DY119_06905 [Apilactobacillus micheneri]
MIIIKQLKKSKFGFTNIEMIIVLMITSLFIGITLFIYPNIKNYQRNDEQKFWNSFKYQWDSIVMSTKINKNEKSKITSTIIVNKNNVHFIYWNGVNKSLNIPNTMSIYGNSYIIDIKSGGYVAPATYRWHSNLLKKDYIQTFQLGWGVYHIE